MAIYGRDFYGLTKYGADLQPQFSVEPFVALPDGYNTVRLTWSNPSGSWTALRLLKSRSGFAVNQNDGQVLIDTSSAATSYVDTDLIGGAYYYYTLFLQSGGNWFRVGTTSQLAVARAGYLDLLLDRIPRYYHYITKYPDGTIKPYFNSAELYASDRPDQINQNLISFVAVIAWAFDYLRTYHESVLWANRPRLTHYENVANLALTLGTQVEPEAPSALNRAKVANAALLARRRGTIRGLEDQVLLSTGYPVSLEVSNNAMLSSDSGSFANPKYPEWSPGTLYAQYSRVTYAGRVFDCLTQAIGQAQKPPDAPTASNTWWTALSNGAILTNATTVDAHGVPINPLWKANGSIANWKGWLGDLTGNTPVTTGLGISVSTPFDSTKATSNALYVKNASGSASVMTLWGAANDDNTTQYPTNIPVITQGIPVPRLLAWDAEADYTTGMLVVYGARAFRAKRDSTGRTPDDFPNDWAQVGMDERAVLALSYYSHADFDGTAGVGLSTHVAFYDERGNLLSDVVSSHISQGTFFDTFNGRPNTTLTVRTPDIQVGSETWTVRSGQDWRCVQTDTNVRVATPVDTSTSQVITTTIAAPTFTKYRVAVTFTKDALPGKSQALILRWQSSTDHMRVTRTGVTNVAAGTPSVVATFSTPIKDGDRVIVWLDEDNNTQTVYVNGTQRALVTGQPQPTTANGRFRHGMAVI